ncbi:sulfite exporter TauE/SafE family protein [Gordonia sp. PP30]|uniref:sulfite exporter TauE/SafE family protein n=1 Tax=unclassified Gordonia (in: high G+C Gram-positive bacteria) TaxID=2657482 RepID=UPI001FFF67B6|nr:sulfite exporter TauE/SafE family protein [Gordonia sp. PP30]UQE75836.1 sulfite exporter TauE/SafE family protein [Gordonia sp. PP30]
MTLADVALLFAAGFAAGVVGYVTGLASIISYPALLAAGLPPIVANVTNTVAMVAVGVGSFAKSGRVLVEDGDAPALVRAVLVALAGGGVGAVVLLASPDTVFEVVVPYLVALASIALLLQPRLRARMGERVSHPGWWLLGVFAVSIYGGYFGAGAGVMFVALAMVLSAMPLWRATLLKSALLGVANAVAAALFIVFSHVHWGAALAMGLGCLLGGWAGPPIVARLPATPLRIAIGVGGLGLAVWLAIH